MGEFDDKLRQTAAQWKSENAPKGLPTCPNCALREKAGPPFDGEFYWCTAKPVLPAFARATCGNSMTGHVGHPINLALFDPASPYATALNAEVCPLFEVVF